MKKILIAVLILFATKVYAQYNNFYDKIIKSKLIFKTLPGSFIAEKYKLFISTGDSTLLPYGYIFSDTSIKIEYYNPINNADSGCSYFVVNDQRINLKDHFRDNFACDLDMTSFKVYKGEYKGHKYILLTCINNGSGSSTSDVICNLFDVTYSKKITYYPLWSKYGSASSFGDFNNDGHLDFLQSRIQGHNYLLKLTLLSLKNGKFFPYNRSYYILIKKNNQNLEIVKKCWFK